MGPLGGVILFLKSRQIVDSFQGGKVSKNGKFSELATIVGRFGCMNIVFLYSSFENSLAGGLAIRWFGGWLVGLAATLLASLAVGLVGCRQSCGWLAAAVGRIVAAQEEGARRGRGIVHPVFPIPPAGGVIIIINITHCNDDIIIVFHKQCLNNRDTKQ